LVQVLSLGQLWFGCNCFVQRVTESDTSDTPHSGSNTNAKSNARFFFAAHCKFIVKFVMADGCMNDQGSHP